MVPVRFQKGKLVAGAKGSCTPKYLRSMLIVGSTEFSFKPTTRKKDHTSYYLPSVFGEEKYFFGSELTKQTVKGKMIK